MRTGSSSHPVYREIQALREQYNADLVGLIVSNRATTCGCGSQPYSWYYDTSDFAYFTTTDECATNNLSFAHEIGHSFVSKRVPSFRKSLLKHDNQLSVHYFISLTNI